MCKCMLREEGQRQEERRALIFNSIKSHWNTQWKYKETQKKIKSEEVDNCRLLILSYWVIRIILYSNIIIFFYFPPNCLSTFSVVESNPATSLNGRQYATNKKNIVNNSHVPKSKARLTMRSVVHSSALPEPKSNPKLEKCNTLKRTKS